jgi:subtilisin family serine protease
MGWGGRHLSAAIVATACLWSLCPAATASESGFAPGELIVRFEAGTTTAARAAARREVGAEVGEHVSGHRTQVLELRSGDPVPGAVGELEALPAVDYAEPNFLYELHAIPNDPLFGDQAGLNNVGQLIAGQYSGVPGADIRAPQAWDVATGDPSVTIAIADSGIDAGHPDLAPNLIPGYDYSGNDDPDPSPDPLAQGSNHGSHIAGIAGAAGDNAEGVAGVSWHSALMPLKVSGPPTPADPAGIIRASDVEEAFRHAADAGARVVNASLGGPNFSETIENAMNDSPGTLFVVSAGNDSTDVETDFTEYPCESGVENLICVTSTNHADAGAWGFANWGATSVDLAAPGRDILSTVLTSQSVYGGPYDFKTGTSMSAPHVAGVAALLFAQNPNASPTQVRSAILSSVDPLPTLMGRTVTGGRLDAGSALIVETAIVRAPKKKVKRPKVKFGFESPNHEPARFECRLDAKKPKSCSATERFKVTRGRHHLEVAAVDGLGRQDPTPAIYTWKFKKPR